jgi:tetratricopeptide (TPR) repeat protein
MYTLRSLGLTLEAEHKWADAEIVHREALALSRKKGDENSEALADLEKVVRDLTAQKKFVEAQQLLDRMLTPAFVVKPESVNLLVQRVNVMGRRGRWREAAADACLALENQLTEHYRYHTLAGLLAMMGDRPAYEEICKKLVTKFADSPNPYICERVVQDCLLLPNSAAELNLLDKLADKAVTAGTGTDGFPYFQACKAMSHYRLGNFSEAVAWGERAATSSTGLAQAKAYAVISMGHWQLGQTNEAGGALGKGNALAPPFSADKGDTDLGESWVAWVMARISLDEATQLIQPGSTLRPTSNSP